MVFELNLNTVVSFDERVHYVYVVRFAIVHTRACEHEQEQDLLEEKTDKFVKT